MAPRGTVMQVYFMTVFVIFNHVIKVNVQHQSNLFRLNQRRQFMGLSNEVRFPRRTAYFSRYN